MDSLRSALGLAGLQMASITLEPNAAINVIVPPSMRRLNLALVDIGAEHRTSQSPASKVLASAWFP